MERVWQERIFNCPFLFLQLKCIMTLKSDTESTCLQSQPYLCNVIQNYRVRMKVGLSSRKKKKTCSFIRQCLSSFNLHAASVRTGHGSPGVMDVMAHRFKVNLYF